VTQQGVQVEKVSAGFLLLVTLTSSDGKLDDVALSDYLARNVMNEIKRLDGVGKAQLYGAERAMRIWIDPQKLIGFNLTGRRQRGHRAQNAQVSAGSIGDLPDQDPGNHRHDLVKGQLSTPAEFADIVLKANPTAPPCASAMWRGSRSAARNTSSPRA
jgi:multidrug efflux pump